MSSGKVKKGEHSESDILQAIKDLEEKFSKRLDEIQNSVVTNLTAVIYGEIEMVCSKFEEAITQNSE